MSDFKNSIQLSIKLDPQNQAQKDLTKIIEKLSKNEINLSIGKQAQETLASLSKTFDVLYSKANKSISLDSLTKSAEESAKVFQSIGEEIGKIHEKSDLKINTNNSLKEAKELNKILEDNYKTGLKEAEAQKQVQQEIQKQTQLLEIQKQSLTRQYGNKIDTSYIDESISKLKSLDNVSMKDLKSEISNIGTNIKGITEQAKGSESTLSKLGSSLRNIGIYVDAGDIFRGLVNSAKDAVGYVVKIEDSMVSLKRVVDGISETGFNNLQNDLHSMAVDTASTTSDMVETVTDWKKLGYSLQEAKGLAEQSTKFNLAGDINNIKTTTTDLIAIIRGFGIENDKAVGKTKEIGDAINQLSNNYAVSSQDLADAMKRSSSALKLAGNDINQSLSLATVSQEVNQDSEKVGTGLKTISMRLRGVSTDGEELDAKLGQLVKNATGVDMTMNGAFRSTYDILHDIAKVWNSGALNDMTKADLAEKLFGKNQATVGIAILENFKQLDSTMKSLGNSAGSVEQEFARSMDSTSAKVKQLKENVGGIFTQFVNSNMTKGVVTGLNSFVTASSNVIKTIGAMPTVIGTVVASLSIFNTKFRESMTSYQPATLTNWISKLKDMSKAHSDSIVIQKQNIESTKNYITAQKEAGVNVTGLQGKLAMMQGELAKTTIAEKACAIGATLLGTAFNMAIGVGISLAISKVIELANAQDTLKQKNQEYIQSLQDKNPQSNQKLLDNYKSLQGELSTLKQGTQEYKEKEEQLATAQQNLIDLYPQASTAIDENTGKKKLNAGATQDLIDKEKQFAQAEAVKTLSNNDVKKTEDIQKLADAYSKAKAEMDKYQEMYNNGQRTVKEAKSTRGGAVLVDVDISPKLEKAKETTEQYQAKLESTKGAISQLEDKSGSYNGALDVINSTLGINTDKVEENTKAKEKNSDIETNINNQANIIAKATTEYDKSTQAIAQAQIYLDKLNKTGQMTPTIAKQISTTYKDIGDSVNSVSTAHDYLTKKIKDEQVAQAQAYEVMNGDSEEFYQNKIKNNQEFQDAYNNLLNSFTTDGEQAYTVDFNNYKTLNELKQGTQSDLGIAIENWLVSIVGESAKNYGIDFGNFKSYAEAKAKILEKLQADISIVTQQMNNAIASAKKYADEVANGMTSETGMSADGSSFTMTENEARGRATANANYADTLANKLGNLDTAYKKVSTSFDEFDGKMQGASVGGLGGTSDFGGTGGGSGKSNSDAEKAQKEAEEWKKKIDELKSDVKDNDMYYDANNAIKLLDNSMTSLKTSEEGLTGVDLAKAKQKEIDIMNQQINAQKRLQSLQEIEKGNIEGTLSQYGILADSTGNLSNAYSILAQKKQEAESMDGSSEPEFEAKKKALQQVSDLNDLITKHTQLVNEDIPKTIDKWQQYANAIKKANDDAVKTLRDDLVGYYLQQQNDEVDKLKEKATKAEEKAKKALETEKQNTLNEYDSQIKAKQALIDALDDDTSDNEAKLKGLIQDRDNWLKDNSTYSKSHVDTLNKEISDLQKTMQKNSIQKDIDSLNEQKKSASDSYDDQLSDLEEANKKQEEANEKKYKKMTDSKKAYQKIDEMITNNNEKAMVKLYQSYGDSYKEIGSLYGENVTAAFKEKLSEMETIVKDITKKISSALDVDVDVKSSSGGSSSSSSWSDPYSHNNEKTTSGTTSDGISYTETTGTYGNGTPYTIVKSSGTSTNANKTYSNGDYTDSNGWYHVASYATGGRTPSNIPSSGVNAILHADEKILNKEETEDWSNAVDKINDLSKIDEIYKSIIATDSVLMNQLYLSSNYAMPNVMPTMGMDLSSMSKNVVNNSNSNTGDTKIELYNEFNINAQNSSQVKNLPNDILKVIKTEIKDLKFNNINR
ncbi:phage tail tape measure protein [Clostridium chromiireducens]|uniref:Phage tail tape measure protein n=1 Tax=Clostridium chromiireducens TaxID=225345 RepID=A0A964RN21_9CLOT|nr:phage tail tape measure protein [Clostridium chromiireducens]MVX64652.1 phage tail tape measure protein [Clostridium chromiireducens]